MAFYLKFEHKVTGEDLYPLIHKVYDEGRVPDGNRVRYDMFKRLGYFVTESSEHFSEYVPWFIKRDRPDMIEKFNIPLDEYILAAKSKSRDGKACVIIWNGPIAHSTLNAAWNLAR